MRLATDVFSEWAQIGKDEGMEKGHAPAVNDILSAALQFFRETEFTAIDAGCGNGWVIRRLNTMDKCISSIGVDGAASMIDRAKEIDPNGIYLNADLSNWNPENPVDLVHSMEVLYYLDDIPGFIKRVHQYWLKSNGIFAFGIDHYLENEESHGWSEKVGTKMAMYSELEWKKMAEDAGFEVVQMFRAAQTKDWAGTLSLILKKSP